MLEFEEEEDNVDYLLDNENEEEESGEFEPILDDDEHEDNNIAELKSPKQKRTSLPTWLKEHYADT